MTLRFGIKLLLMAALLSGCIRDSHKKCVQGLHISFYSKSSCEADTVWPVGIDRVVRCIFDKDDLLVDYREINGSELDRAYIESVEVAAGFYTVVAWADLYGESFNISALQPGTTKKSDLFFRLKRAGLAAASIEGIKIYYGESTPAYLPGNQSLFEKVAVNLQEITNRLTVTLEGLPGGAEEYEIAVESDNGSMNLNGTIAGDDVINHGSQLIYEDGVLKTAVTLLRLEIGQINTIVVKHLPGGNELYRGSLLGTLLLKNPEVNLECDHDFTIRFTAQDQCDCGTYTITEIWVNNWLVHSYDTEL